MNLGKGDVSGLSSGACFVLAVAIADTIGLQG